MPDGAIDLAPAHDREASTAFVVKTKMIVGRQMHTLRGPPTIAWCRAPSGRAGACTPPVGEKDGRSSVICVAEVRPRPVRRQGTLVVPAGLSVGAGLEVSRGPALAFAAVVAAETASMAAPICFWPNEAPTGS